MAEEDEVEGLDLSQHSESAYGFSTGGQTVFPEGTLTQVSGHSASVMSKRDSEFA